MTVAHLCRPRIHFLFAFAVVPWLAAPLLSQEVEIVVDDAAVKVLGEVVATAKRGERYSVVRVQLPWVAIAVERGGNRRVGWVLADKVRTIVDPALDETSPAPAAPAAFHVAVDMTQAHGTTLQSFVMPRGGGGGGGGGGIVRQFGGLFRGSQEAGKLPASCLCFRLSLRNNTNETIAVSAANFKLRVDNQELDNLAPADIARILAAPEVVDFRGDPCELAPLSDGQLAPGDGQQGWLCFDLTSLPVEDGPVRIPKADRWLLHAMFGNHSLEFDLQANEIQALDATVRPSRLDRAVQVVEVGSRLNALNLKQLIAALETLKNESAVVFHETTSDGLYDDAAHTFFRALQQAARYGGNRDERRFPQLCLVPANPPNAALQRRRPFPVARPSAFYGPRAASEAAAALQILGERPGTGSQLVQHLADESAEVRTASAQALARHLAEPGVVEALVAATKDAEPKVRTASVYALGAALASALPAARQPDSADTAAVVDAMHDASPLVRNAAAMSAKAFPSAPVENDLIALLGDPDFSVRVTACHSLGKLSSQAAIPRLKELSILGSDDRIRAGRSTGRGGDGDAAVKTAAIEALVALGAMSEVDAALAKLDGGNPSPQDFTILCESHDERAAPALIELLRSSLPNVSPQAIQALGDLGDARAVEPLLEALNLTHMGGRDDVVVQALGKLRDRRAIQPLRRRLAKIEDPRLRISYVCALLLVDDPEAFKEMQSLLQAPNNFVAPHVGQLLEALGGSGHVKATEVIEPFLDDARHCQSAAKALAASRLPKAYQALLARLESAKYAYGAQVVGALAQNRAWALSPHGHAILKRAAQSPNPTTRASAAVALRSLEAANQ